MSLGHSIYKLALYVVFSTESAQHWLWPHFPVENKILSEIKNCSFT